MEEGKKMAMSAVKSGREKLRVETDVNLDISEAAKVGIDLALHSDVSANEEEQEEEEGEDEVIEQESLETERLLAPADSSAYMNSLSVSQKPLIAEEKPIDTTNMTYELLPLALDVKLPSVQEPSHAFPEAPKTDLQQAKEEDPERFREYLEKWSVNEGKEAMAA